MLTLIIRTPNGGKELKLPTDINELTSDYINEVTDHVKPEVDYSLIGIIYKEKLSTIMLASKKNNKTSDIAIIPIFIKTGGTKSELINNLKTGDKLIISPSDIMLGYHIAAPRNILTIDNILSIVNNDNSIYQKALTTKKYCYFIEFKLVPNCNIHGAYCTDYYPNYTNPFIADVDDTYLAVNHN